MSRNIDLTQPLSDEDRQYLMDRSRLRDIALADGLNPPVPLPADSIADAFGQHPDATDASAGQNAQQAEGQQAQGSQDLASPATEHQQDQEPDGDNYDDEEAWPYDDLKEEIKERDASDKPALNSKREDLISWLRMDDAR